MARKRIRENLAYDDKRRRFYAYFDLGAGADGKRRRRAKTFATEEEALEALRSFHWESTPRAEWLTVGQWLDYWLENVVGSNLEYTTYYCYRNIIKKHVEPALGKIRLSELSPTQIQQYYAHLTQVKGLSANTVRKHHILLHTAFKLAYRQAGLPNNLMERVEPPRERPAQRLYYTPQELKRLLQAAVGTEVELIVKLAGYLGLRRGEICGLRWEDVDLTRRLISIRRARTTAGARVVEKEPKTGSSIRCLSIAALDDLVELLWKARETAGPCGFVLERKDGRPWHPNQMSRAVSGFVRDRGLPPITVHGLRHTFASVANSVHIPLPDISRALGHRDVVVTGRIYTHIFDQTCSEAVSAVAQCIRQA